MKKLSKMLAIATVAAAIPMAAQAQDNSYCLASIGAANIGSGAIAFGEEYLNGGNTFGLGPLVLSAGDTLTYLGVPVLLQAPYQGRVAMYYFNSPNHPDGSGGQDKIVYNGNSGSAALKAVENGCKQLIQQYLLVPLSAAKVIPGIAD